MVECVEDVYHGVIVEVKASPREQVLAFLPPCWYQGLNSDPQATSTFAP